MSNSFTEVKEQATIQIIAQLHAMTEEETRAFISKLLDMLGYEQVLALHFAYEMTPNQPRGTLEAQEQAPILVHLREELIDLTDLRARVVKENDTLSRIFAAYRKDETPVPTWDELNRAEKALESKVPGFHVWYVSTEKAYTLLPDLEYQSSGKEQVPGEEPPTDEAKETYNLLSPFMDDMWVEGLEVTPLSLEAYYQHKGSKLSYSHAVLQAAIAVWNASRRLESACRNQID